MEPKYFAFRFGDYTPLSLSDKAIGSPGKVDEFVIHVFLLLVC